MEDQPYPFGHFLFKYVAPAEAIVFPPSPFLHNYLYNLAYLPIRKLKLFGANLFPDLFGLSKQFDPEHYAKNRTDYTTSFIGDGKLVDMEHQVPRATLLAEPREQVPRTLVARLFTRLNGGEDHLFTKKIAREAKAHGAQLVFVHLPMFEGPQTVSDRGFSQTIRSRPQLRRPRAARRIVRELVAFEPRRRDERERQARGCDRRSRPLIEAQLGTHLFAGESGAGEVMCALPAGSRTNQRE